MSKAGPSFRPPLSVVIKIRTERRRCSHFRWAKYFNRGQQARIMFRSKQIRTAMSLVALMLLSSILPGCLETVSDVIDEDESTHPNAAPIEAMGMWWPTIDGVIEIPTVTPITEWSDSDMIDIKFTDGTKVKHPATLRYKSVDEGMALTVEIGDVEETPQQIVVTFPDRTITTEISTESDAFVPMFEIDCLILDFDCSADESKKIIDKDDSMSVELLEYMVLNKIASVHDLDDDNLVMEASAKRLFDDTTEITYTIDIVFEESTWTFTKVTDFDWVLPFLFPRSDISVTGIEVIQTVQTADMQIPLVEGKTSLARVYVDSGDLETANVEVTLNFCFLIFCFDEMTKTHVAVQSPDRTDFTHSANFVLPNHWVTYEGIDDPIPIGLIATIKPVYPTGAIDYLDPDTSNNYDLQVFELNPTHDLSVYVLPTREDVTWDSVDDIVTRNEATMEYWMDTTEAAFPVGNLEVTYLSPVLSPDLTDADAGEVNDWLKILDAFLSMGFDYDQMFGARPSQDDGGISDPMWSSSGTGLSRVSNCGDTGSTSRQLCAAHEMIHNLGPINFDGGVDGFSGSDSNDEDWGSHLQCAASSQSGSDSVWKNRYGSADQNANILDIGWDSNVPFPEINSSALIPSSYPDLMSYCMAGNGPVADSGSTSCCGNQANTGTPWNLPYITNQTKWMSTYHYLYLYNQLSDWDISNPPYLDYYSSTTGSSADGRQSLNPNSTIRVVRGVTGNPALTNNSQPSFSHSWESEGTCGNVCLPAGGVSVTQKQSNYSIRVLDSSGNLLNSVGYNPVFEAHESNITGDDYFSFFFQDNGLINSVEIIDTSSGSIIDSLYSSSPPVIRVLPLGTAEYTRENPANISWTQASSTSNRQTLYQLEYSWGADIWLPIGGMTSSTNTVLDFDTLPGGTNNSMFRVRATNGFDTYYSESSTFSLLNQAPMMVLETSGALGMLHDTAMAIHGSQSSIEDIEVPLQWLTQGDSFSITPDIRDDDWTSINENSCSATLKQNGEIVWADGLQKDTDSNSFRGNNRVTTWPTSLEHGPGLHDSVHCLHNNGAFLPYSFPNKDLLPSEMTPGNYVFEMTYVDVGGASVTETVSFSIIVPDFLVGHDSTSSAGEVLQEYRSKLKMMSNISKMLNDNLSRDELQYYVELERAARGDENMLSDAEMLELQEFYGISDSRDAEFIDAINQTDGDSTTSAPEKN